MNCPQCSRPLVHLMSDCLFCAQPSSGWPAQLTPIREPLRIDVTPETLKAEIDQQHPETNFDLRLGREQLRIPANLTYRNVGISGASATGKTRVVNSLLQQIRAMKNQKCLIFDINGWYYTRFGQPGDKVLSVNSNQSELWNFWNENVPLEHLAETLADVNQDNIFFSASGRGLSTFSLMRWATSPSNEWVFLNVRLQDLAESSSLLRLWFELAILGVLQRDVDSDEPHLWLIADELPGLGKVTFLEKLLAQTRKYKASVIATYQGSTQLQNIYGTRTKAIIHRLENKIRFRTPPEPRTAREVSLELGLPLVSEIESLPDLQAYLKICSFAPTRIHTDNR